MLLNNKNVDIKFSAHDIFHLCQMEEMIIVFFNISVFVSFLCYLAFKHFGFERT